MYEAIRFSTFFQTQNITSFEESHKRSLLLRFLLQMLYYASSAPIECTPCKSKNYRKQFENIMEKSSVLKQESSETSGKGGSSPSDAVKPRNKCCPYNFDSKLCQVVNDRILCGFERNIGRPQNDAAPINLSGGCRIRGGRLECGYDQSPFMGIRRPPAWNNGGNPSLEQDADENEDDDNNDTNKQKLYLKGISNANKQKLFLQSKKSTKKQGGVTQCVEIKDRIVCKYT